MPHFSLGLSASGPILKIVVGVSNPRAQALQAAGLKVPNAVVLDCLVDTGASVTCMDATALAPLALQPTGSTSILTPSTGQVPIDYNLYDVAIAMGLM